jgi:hypothetical protein
MGIAQEPDMGGDSVGLAKAPRHIFNVHTDFRTLLYIVAIHWKKHLFYTFKPLWCCHRTRWPTALMTILLSLCCFLANLLAIRSWLTRKHIQRLHTAATVIKSAWQKWRVSMTGEVGVGSV